MGQLEQMIAYQKAHGMLKDMADERALEMQARKPNMLRKQMLLNTVPAELEGLRGGGKPGLQRIVGGARKMKKAEEAAAKYLSYGAGAPEESDSEDEGEKKEELHGGFLPFLAAAAVPLLGKLFGNGKPLKRGAGAKQMGRHLGEQIKELHGEGFLDDLVSGIGSVVGKMFGAGVSGGAKEPTFTEYSKGIAMNRVVPGGIEARGQQVPDYAPKWFRESGDIAGGAKPPAMYGGPGSLPPASRKAAGAGKLTITHGAGVSGGAKRKLSDRQRARNAMVKKLMTEKGMSLPEASRYIKEHSLI